MDEKVRQVVQAVADAFNERKLNRAEAVEVCGNIIYMVGCSLERIPGGKRGPNLREAKTRLWNSSSAGNTMIVMGLLMLDMAAKEKRKRGKDE